MGTQGGWRRRTGQASWLSARRRLIFWMYDIHQYMDICLVYEWKMNDWLNRLYLHGSHVDAGVQPTGQLTFHL